MKTYGDMACKQLEVPVYRVNRHPIPYTNSTHQKIGIGSLNSFRTAEIKVSGSQNIILCKNIDPFSHTLVLS